MAHSRFYVMIFTSEQQVGFMLLSVLKFQISNTSIFHELSVGIPAELTAILRKKEKGMMNKTTSKQTKKPDSIKAKILPRNSYPWSVEQKINKQKHTH